MDHLLHLDKVNVHEGDQKEIFGHLLFYEATPARGYALEEDSAPQVKTRFAPAPPIVCFVIACAITRIQRAPALPMSGGGHASSRAYPLALASPLS